MIEVICQKMKRMPKTRNLNVLYFFFAWNAFGLCVFKLYKEKIAENSEWKKMDYTQRYFKLMGRRDEPVTKVSVSGFDFANYKSEKTTFEEIVKPASE